MIGLLVLLVFSVLICEGQLVGAPFYPKAIGLSSGGFGGGDGGGHFGGDGGHFAEGVVHWYPGFGLGGLGGSGAGSGGYGGHQIGDGGIGGHGIGIGIGGKGGEADGGGKIEHSAFKGGKKNSDNHHFVQSHGKKGEELHHGNGGFSKGEVAETNVKGETAHFSDAHGGKALYHDGKDYHGGEHYSKAGHGGSESTNKKGHKKGHRIKGFKNSHHLDEHGGTEEYYDEAHDEGGNYAFKGESAGFGEKGASSFKGGHEGGKYNVGERKKSGHYGQEHSSGKSEGNEEKFGGHKYSGNKGAVGEHKVVGSDDFAGYEDSSKFFKHY